jgi:hypothetical protein
MASTTPLCPWLNRRQTALPPFRYEFAKFLVQTIGDRGRLGGAIGQNHSDELEDIAAVPFVLRHPEVLERPGAAVVLGPLPIERTEPFDGLGQALPPGDDFLRHLLFGLPAATHGLVPLIQPFVAADGFR